MTRDIGKWLEGLGLGRYAEAFADNEIDLPALPHISEQDLTEIGVALGARRRLLAAIAELGDADERSDERSASAGAEAERRQLTVMFVDLVGSTALAEQLDPEDLRAVVGAFQESGAGVIANFEGYIARYMGDGLLVYFGYPQAHEDDAERAVRAGLGIVAAVAELKTHRDGKLEVRVGIATGLVVVGDIIGEGASEERAVLGETPNLAARLQGLAEPNQVVIADATQRLIAGLFDSQALPAQTIKGIAKPVRAYRVQAASRVSSRFEASAARGLTALVGRDEEIGLLLKRWQQAQEGEGQVVLLSSEAGVGKSRILRGLQERLEGEAMNRVLYYCSPYHRNSALHPLIDQLQRALRLENDDGPEQKLDKLEAVLSDLDLASDERAAVLADLLSLPTEGRYPPLELSPPQLRAKTLDAIITVIEAMATRQTVLMVVEDVHWIDPSTEEFLGQLVERSRTARLLLVITFRPEFRPPWSSQAHLTAYALNNLGRRDCAALVARITGGKALPAEVIEQIVARTDGVPLFVEELTTTVLESGALRETADGYALSADVSDMGIPASLQDSLMARLDRLAPIKEVAQRAATLGRTFSFELLAAVAPQDDHELAQALNQLVAAGLIYQRGSPPDAAYEFKHALVRDTAYESLLKSTRQLYHGEIATALEETFAATAEPELLAHHFSEAGQTDQAVNYWSLAGQRSLERSANVEAAAHFQNAIDQLSSLPPSPHRVGREIELQANLGVALLPVKGYTHPDVAAAYRRSKELCEETGDKPGLFTALWGLWINKQFGMAYAEAKKLSSDLLTLAREQGDNELILQAHHAAWTTCYVRGEFEEVAQHTAAAEDLYDLEKHASHVYRFGGHDPGICGHNIAAHASWMLGYPDHALRHSEAAVRLAKVRNHPLSTGTAYSHAAGTAQFCGDVESARRHAGSALSIAEEHGYVGGMWLANASATLAWALAEDGAIQEALECICVVLEKQALPVFRPNFLSVYAEICLKFENFEDAHSALDEALELVEKNDERWWETELYRQKGEIHMIQNAGRDEIEPCFERAIDIAQARQLRSLELRAATSMARLHAAAGDRAEAISVLAPIHDWFTEGFSTADLQAARALLEELS